MLYLVATPIGNLADMTFRAVETLKAVDYILCEDTRHSQILLHHYSIQKTLKSYHKFNESKMKEQILSDLRHGSSIALISDAGTPGISDPGTMLVQACVAENLPVTAIPGPCAAIAAISCSGLDTDHFQFLGFLPKKDSELKSTLREILCYKGTTICYESPQRIMDVLHALAALSPDRKLAIGRELTKKFEEIVRGKPQDIIAHWMDKTIKGEIVLMISGQKDAPNSQDWVEMTPEEHVAFIESTYGISRKEAIPIVAKIRGVSKSHIYNTVHRQPKNSD